MYILIIIILKYLVFNIDNTLHTVLSMSSSFVTAPYCMHVLLLHSAFLSAILAIQLGAKGTSILLSLASHTLCKERMSLVMLQPSSCSQGRIAVTNQIRALRRSHPLSWSKITSQCVQQMSASYYLTAMFDNCVPRRQLGSCSMIRPFLSALARLHLTLIQPCMVTSGTLAFIVRTNFSEGVQIFQKNLFGGGGQFQGIQIKRAMPRLE